MALERYPKRPLVRDGLEDLEAEKKRRRIPLEQVVQELSHAGLAQPALSFVQEVRAILVKDGRGPGFLGIPAEDVQW